MHIDNDRVDALARVVAGLPAGQPGLNFYSYQVAGQEVIASDMYPPLEHPSAIDFFFFVCAHQHGFWHDDVDGYRAPLYGNIDGKKCKGSDLLWKVCMRALNGHPDPFAPRRLATIDRTAFAQMFSDDDGPIAFPDLEERLALTRAYGEKFVVNNTCPAELVTKANAVRSLGITLGSFLSWIILVPGYSGDPIQKKALLLAMALSSRPERFLKVTEPERWRPIVDYHLMRLALRTGLVVLGATQLAENEARRWVDEGTEEVIRGLTYVAVERVMKKSRRSLAVVDHAFWSARRFCPEMEAPDCDKCSFSAACAKRTKLFQPVFRTTNY